MVRQDLAESAGHVGRALLVVDQQAVDVPVADRPGELQHVQLLQQAPDRLGPAVVEVHSPVGLRHVPVRHYLTQAELGFQCVREQLEGLSRAA